MRLRGLGLCVLATGIALSFVGPASATAINGTISITGTDNIDYGNHTVGILQGQTQVNAATGDFLAAGFNFQDLARQHGHGLGLQFKPELRWWSYRWWMRL